MLPNVTFVDLQYTDTTEEEMNLKINVILKF